MSGVCEAALLGLWACGAPLNILSSETSGRRPRASLLMVEGTQANVFPLAVSLLVQAILLSAKWAGQRRQLCLEEAGGVADHGRLIELQARVLTLGKRTGAAGRSYLGAGVAETGAPDPRPGSPRSVVRGLR